LVPARKACIPEAPDGGHSTHAGTLLEGAVAALPEDPPGGARDDDVDPALLGVLDRLPKTPPEVPLEVPLVDEAAPADPVAELPVVVLAAPGVAAGVTEVVADPAGAEVPVPSVTMPLRVTPPGVAVVCAHAGKAAATETSTE